MSTAIDITGDAPRALEVVMQKRPTGPAPQVAMAWLVRRAAIVDTAYTARTVLVRSDAVVNMEMGE